MRVVVDCVLLMMKEQMHHTCKYKLLASSSISAMPWGKLVADVFAARAMFSLLRALGLMGRKLVFVVRQRR
jgi:hypothetical protein